MRTAQKNNSKKGVASLKLLEVGLFELGFVVVIIAIILGVLNYFNIVSLSQLYPNQLGWLPQQTKYREITVERLPKPQELSKGTKTYAVNGFFSSRTEKNFTINTSTGSMTFDFDKDTTFLKVDNTINKTDQYKDPEEFFKQIKSGNLLFVTYSLSGGTLKAEQIQFMSSFK